VANKDVEKKIEEIPIPFRDLKNVVEELRFEDEPTRMRCRGWLVLQSRQFLQASIIFPGSDIDCRLSIRARSGNIVFQLLPSIRMAVSGRVSRPSVLCSVRKNNIPWHQWHGLNRDGGGVGGGGGWRNPL